MTLFEFLMVIAGVVIAIAMAEIVSGWGKMLRAGVRFQSDLLHLGWSLTVLLNAMLYWVGVWAYADVEFQYVAQTWFLIFPTLFLVLVAYALMPDGVDIGGQSLRDYYISNRRTFFSSYVLFLVFSTAADLVIGGDFIASGVVEGMVFILVIAGGCCLAVTDKTWAHYAGLAVYLSLMLASGMLPLEDVTLFGSGT